MTESFSTRHQQSCHARSAPRVPPWCLWRSSRDDHGASPQHHARDSQAGRPAGRPRAAPPSRRWNIGPDGTGPTLHRAGPIMGRQHLAVPFFRGIQDGLTVSGWIFRRTCSLEAHRVPPAPPAAARTGAAANPAVAAEPGQRGDCRYHPARMSLEPPVPRESSASCGPAARGRLRLTGTAMGPALWPRSRTWEPGLARRLKLRGRLVPLLRLGQVEDRGVPGLVVPLGGARVGVPHGVLEIAE